MATTELIKTINGLSCDVYAIIGNDRIMIGTATPEVEFYEKSVRVSTVGGSGISYKVTHSSIVLCPDPEMSAGITFDMMRKISAFDLALKLPRGKDNVIVPVDLFGIYEADISEDEWKFTITDPRSVRNLMIL